MDGGAWNGQGERPGALGHAAKEGTELQKEKRVQSTNTARWSGGHHGHVCLQGPNGQQNLSSTQGTHVGE